MRLGPDRSNATTRLQPRLNLARIESKDVARQAEPRDLARTPAPQDRFGRQPGELRDLAGRHERTGHASPLRRRYASRPRHFFMQVFASRRDGVNVRPHAGFAH